jgi:hypothetical protein
MCVGSQARTPRPNHPLRHDLPHGGVVPLSASPLTRRPTGAGPGDSWPTFRSASTGRNPWNVMPVFIPRLRGVVTHGTLWDWWGGSCPVPPQPRSFVHQCLTVSPIQPRVTWIPWHTWPLSARSAHRDCRRRRWPCSGINSRVASSRPAIPAGCTTARMIKPKRIHWHMTLAAVDGLLPIIAVWATNTRRFHRWHSWPLPRLWPPRWRPPHARGYTDLGAPYSRGFAG